MNEAYFNSVENEWYYYPNIKKERNKYIIDKDNFNKITNILDSLENDFQKEKDANQQTLNIKNSVIADMMQEDINSLKSKKKRYKKLQNKLNSVENDIKTFINDTNKKCKTNAATIYRNRCLIDEYRKEGKEIKEEIKMYNNKRQQIKDDLLNLIEKNRKLVKKEQSIFDREKKRIIEKKSMLPYQWDILISERDAEEIQVELQIQNLEKNKNDKQYEINMKKKSSHQTRRKLMEINKKISSQRKKGTKEKINKENEIKDIKAKISQLQQQEKELLNQFDNVNINTNSDKEKSLYQTSNDIQTIEECINSMVGIISGLEPNNNLDTAFDFDYDFDYDFDKLKEIEGIEGIENINRIKEIVSIGTTQSNNILNLNNTIQISYFIDKLRDFRNNKEGLLNNMMNSLLDNMNVNNIQRNEIVNNIHIEIKKLQRRLQQVNEEIKKIDIPTMDLIKQEETLMKKDRENHEALKHILQNINSSIIKLKIDKENIKNAKNELIYKKNVVIKSLDEDNQRARERFNKIMERCKTKEHKLNTTNESIISQLQESEQKKRQKLNTLNEKCNKLEIEIQILQKRNELLENEIHRAPLRRENITNEIETLGSEITNLKKSVHERQSEITQMEKEIDTEFRIKEIDFFIRIQEFKKIKQDEEVRLLDMEDILERKKIRAKQMLMLYQNTFNEVMEEIENIGELFS